MTKKMLIVGCGALIAAAFVMLNGTSADAAGYRARVAVFADERVMEAVPMPSAKVVLVRPFFPPPIVEVERRQAAYKIVEEPRPPFVLRGLFKDRVVFPRRPLVSVEEVVYR